MCSPPPFPLLACRLCTSLRMRGAYVYCAYNSGHVRIFDLLSCTQVVQIAASSRWLNAIEVHPNGETFACVSEDTTLCVWRFLDGRPEERKVLHTGSVTVADAMLCGVAFNGGLDRSHVCVAAYDQPAIQAWKID